MSLLKHIFNNNWSRFPCKKDSWEANWLETWDPSLKGTGTENWQWKLPSCRRLLLCLADLRPGPGRSGQREREEKTLKLVMHKLYFGMCMSLFGSCQKRKNTWHEKTERKITVETSKREEGERRASLRPQVNYNFNHRLRPQFSVACKLHHPFLSSLVLSSFFLPFSTWVCQW